VRRQIWEEARLELGIFREQPEGSLATKELSLPPSKATSHKCLKFNLKHFKIKDSVLSGTSSP
jgi:hypothetical protein